MNEAVYADYNASAPLRPEASAAIVRALKTVGNPSSVHGFGRAARRLVEDAREAIATLLDAAAADVVFTAGATEANALALGGSGFPRVLASAVEHESVLSARSDIVRIPVDGNGVVRLNALETELARSDGPALVSVMLANNETGVVQPVPAIVELARAAGARVHCDAVQAVGRLPVSLRDLGVDYLSVSAHKIGGPAGVGALVMAPGAPLTAIVRGGGQERGRRGGTENVAGIAGFGAAAEAARAALADQERQRRLRDDFERRIALLAPEAAVFGAEVERLANTSCIEMPDVKSEIQVMSFDLAGIAVSAGAACSSGKVATSGVLRAMGVSPERAECAIRVSIGAGTSEDHVERLAEVWQEIFRRRRARAA